MKSSPKSLCHNSIRLSRKEFLRLMALAAGGVTLISCGAPGLNAEPTPTLEQPTSAPPTATPQPTPMPQYAPQPAPAVPAGYTAAAVAVPEYQAPGVEITGVTPEQLQELQDWQWLRLYKKASDQEGKPVFFESAEDYHRQIAVFAQRHPELSIHQVQSPDQKSILSYVTRTNSDGRQVVFWDFTKEGAVAFAEPNLSTNETRLGEVILPEGCRPEFDFNPNDGHWYLFAVQPGSGNQPDQAVSWFNTDGATRSNLDSQWPELFPDYLKELQANLTNHHFVKEENGDYRIYRNEENLPLPVWVEKDGTLKLVMGQDNEMSQYLKVDHEYRFGDNDGGVFEVSTTADNTVLLTERMIKVEDGGERLGLVIPERSHVIEVDLNDPDVLEELKKCGEAFTRIWKVTNTGRHAGTFYYQEQLMIVGYRIDGNEVGDPRLSCCLYGNDSMDDHGGKFVWVDVAEYINDFNIGVLWGPENKLDKNRSEASVTIKQLAYEGVDPLDLPQLNRLFVSLEQDLGKVRSITFSDDGNKYSNLQVVIQESFSNILPTQVWSPTIDELSVRLGFAVKE